MPGEVHFHIRMKKWLTLIEIVLVPEGRRQNSLAAALIFSSQLQPTECRKSFTQLLNAAASWLQPAAMNVDLFPKPIEIIVMSVIRLFIAISKAFSRI